MPQSPPAPEGRNPPTSIIPAVGENRMSRSCVTRKGWNRRVRAKTTNDPSETAKYTKGRTPARAPKAPKRAGGDGEEQEGDPPARGAKAEVEAAPHEGDGQDQDGDHDEQRLLLAQLLVVPGIRADPSEPRGPPAPPT